MATEVRLPQLGQTMEEGTIVNCMVKIGDEVHKADVIFEIETDKATLEMESPAAGFVKHIFVEVGQTLPVAAALLILADRDEDVPQSFIDSLVGRAPAAATVEAAPVTPTAAPAEPAKPHPESSPGRIIASPRARKLAIQLGVDLKSVTGTGPAGKVTEEDVRKAAAEKPTAAPPTEAEPKLGATIPINKLQRITAERMLKSKREIPCFYLTVKADVTELVDFRTQLKKTSGVKVAYNDFIIRSVAMGLQKFPLMTGQLVDEAIQLADAVNIGLAVTVPDGLIVPVIKDADKKDVVQIARDSAGLIEKARDNKLLLTDLEGAVITVSNLGALGIDSFIPVVIPGQCSILGIGRITDTCVPDNGNIAVRKLMNMTLSVDHKVANGAYAAGFLDFVRKCLEDTSNLT